MDRWSKAHIAVLMTIAACLFALGCGARMVPLTQDIRLQTGLSDDELKGLQYYLSDTVVLRRVVESQDRRITGAHKLELVAGKMVEEIEIKRGTPGVAVSINSDAIAVSFEPGAALQFSLRHIVQSMGLPDSEPGRTSPTPDPFPGNKRDDPPDVAPARSSGPETGVFWIAVDERTSRVPYAGKLFEPIGDTLQAHLMVRAESLEDVVETKRVLPGMKLPQAPAATPAAQ